MDNNRAKQRSYNMSQIRGKDTKPELFVRRLLWSMGHRYRLHYNKLPGKPDIVFIGKKKAVFVHGCFWHRHDCPNFVWPKSNELFWQEKIEGNVERDNKNQKKLLENGWGFLIIWECAIRNLWKKNSEDKLNEFVFYLNEFLDDKFQTPMEMNTEGISILNEV